MVDDIIRIFRLGINDTVTFKMKITTLYFYSYNPCLSRTGFETIFKVLGNEVSYETKQTLKNVLGKPEDKSEEIEKFREYEEN